MREGLGTPTDELKIEEPNLAAVICARAPRSGQDKRGEPLGESGLPALLCQPVAQIPER